MTGRRSSRRPRGRSLPRICGAPAVCSSRACPADVAAVDYTPSEPEPRESPIAAARTCRLTDGSDKLASNKRQEGACDRGVCSWVVGVAGPEANPAHSEGAGASFRRGRAGFHASLVPWLKARDVSIVGTDAGLDVYPSGIPGAGCPRTLPRARGPWHARPRRHGPDRRIRSRRTQALDVPAQRSPIRVSNGTGSAINAIATFWDSSMIATRTALALAAPRKPRRIIAQTTVTNRLDDDKSIQCGMLVDTGAGPANTPCCLEVPTWTLPTHGTGRVAAGESGGRAGRGMRTGGDQD